MAKSKISRSDYLHNVALSLEEKKIERLLKNNKVEFKILKGLNILKKLTSNYLSVKWVRDIDILVEGRTISKVIDLLSSLGYHEVFYPEKSYQEVILGNRKIGAIIELHTNAFNFVRLQKIDPLFFPLSDKKISGLTKKILDSKLIIGDEYLTLYLGLHFALNHCFRGLERLSTIKDILEKYNYRDWLRLLGLIRKLQLRVYFLIIFDLINYYYGLDFSKYYQKISKPVLLKVYKEVFFLLFPRQSVRMSVDITDPSARGQVKAFYRTIRIVRIVCSEVSLEKKIMYFPKLLWNNI